ncbi:MAG: O-antigen ligase family protein [Porticoccus sp.]|uniref:O-antigen ligase family protein n=1 Tax=Porticoccus sp. TaxID=2024853 RepID=UPI0032977797
MSSARRWNFINFLILAHFPLYGIFSYLRVQEQEILGYLIYQGSMALYISWVWLKAMLRVDVRIPGFIFYRNNRLHSFLFACLLLFMLVGILFAAVLGSRAWFFSVAEAVLLFTLTLFWTLVIDAGRKQPGGMQRILLLVYISLLFYVIINVVGVLVGFESEGQLSKFSRDFEAIFSPFAVRPIFPLTQSGQFFSIIGGILVILSLYGSWFKRLTHPVRFCTVLMGVLVLFGHSARAPIMALILVMVYSLLPRRVLYALLPMLLIAFVALPVAVIYLDAGEYLSQLLVSLGIDVSKSGNDVSSLSNRDVIWSAALNYMFYEAGSFNLWFGHGAYGQIASGVEGSYQWLFKNSYVDLSHPPLHSTYVQTFVDYGIIGFVLLFGVMLMMFSQLRKIAISDRQLYSDSKMLSLLLVYIYICAVTESIISYYTFDILSLFIFLNLYVLAQRSTMMRVCALSTPKGKSCRALKYYC